MSSIQEHIRNELCKPLENVGATDVVTGTDLRRFADNLASFLCGELEKTSNVSIDIEESELVDDEEDDTNISEVPIEIISLGASDEAKVALQPGKVAAREAAEAEAAETESEE